MTTQRQMELNILPKENLISLVIELQNQIATLKEKLVKTEEREVHYRNANGKHITEVYNLKDKLSRTQQALKLADGMIKNREDTISRRNTLVTDLRGKINDYKDFIKAKDLRQIYDSWITDPK